MIDITGSKLYKRKINAVDIYDIKKMIDKRI